MQNRPDMEKIVRFYIFFCLTMILWNCRKKDPEPNSSNPFDSWKMEGETSARSGPGYSWRLSADDQKGTNGYFDLAGNRLFYLNASDSGTREVTLTITKREESLVDPSFRIYGRLGQCLRMSTGTVSSGLSRLSGTFQREGIINSDYYAGITWTPALAQSPVNSKATYSFKVYIDEIDSLCTEGFVQVDMVAPAVINSAGSYLDGDHLYFIKRN